MKSYDIPETEYLTQDEAVKTFAAVNADIVGDKDHPYMNGQHPQHKIFVEAMGKIIEAKSDGDPVTKMCNEAIAEQEEKQQALRDEAQTELDALLNLGYGGQTTLPDKVTNADVVGLRLQRTREMDKTAFINYMEQVLFKCNNLPQEQLAAFADYRRGARDTGGTEEKISGLITTIYKQLKSKEI